MSLFMIDIEADGPCPGIYSMISFGAIRIDSEDCNETFYGELKPISENWLEKSLQVSGITREQSMNFEDPQIVMSNFDAWIQRVNDRKRPIFISDSGFDWQFINYYFWKFLNRNPFGHSSLNLGSLYKGFNKDLYSSFKHLRKTKHTHHPIDDARGNVEAFIAMKNLF